MKKIIKEIFSTSLYLLVVLIACYLVVRYVGQRTQVIGSSMETTLSDGDNLIVDKISYRFGEPRRYDIIVFPYQYDKSTFYIKRIIGMPGETVYIDPRGTIYINGEALQESYGREISLPDWQKRKSLWVKMSILYWEITGTTAVTAEIPMWAIFIKRIFWEKPG